MEAGDPRPSPPLGGVRTRLLRTAPLVRWCDCGFQYSPRPGGVGSVGVQRRKDWLLASTLTLASTLRMVRGSLLSIDRVLVSAGCESS